jgi:hypothetical protein
MRMAHLLFQCRLLPADLNLEHFQGDKTRVMQRWVFTSAYTLNTDGLLPRIVDLARQVCVLVQLFVNVLATYS